MSFSIIFGAVSFSTFAQHDSVYVRRSLAVSSQQTRGVNKRPVSDLQRRKQQHVGDDENTQPNKTHWMKKDCSKTVGS